LAAWLRIGEKLAEDLDLPKYDRARLQSALSALRQVTTASGDLEAAIRDVLGPAGVAFVVAPHLPKTYANGAAFWHANRPVVLLSLRGAYEDIVWFTLFHEVGHILLHERSATFIEGLGAQSNEEEEANQFACDTLIPQSDWDEFRQIYRVDRDDVIALAERQKISPAIIVGRLMHEEGAFHRYHSLRSMRRKLVYD
jgi:HTH-type transcriptional regulator/antitoxin HigA